jgi:hypothetical protein
MQYCNNTYSSGGVLSLEKQEVMFFSSVTGTTMTLQPEELYCIVFITILHCIYYNNTLHLLQYCIVFITILHYIYYNNTLYLLQ